MMKFNNDDEEDVWKRCIQAVLSSRDPEMKIGRACDEAVIAADEVLKEYRKRYDG